MDEVHAHLNFKLSALRIALSTGIKNVSHHQVIPIEMYHSATVADTGRAERDICALFARLGLDLYQTKCDFSSAQSLKILWIIEETCRAQLLLSRRSSERRRWPRGGSCCTQKRHRRHVPAKALRSFARLGNSTGLAVVDARLRLRELLDAISLASQLEEL
jgi:hypothetical protein